LPKLFRANRTIYLTIILNGKRKKLLSMSGWHSLHKIST